jgi:inosine/xanthosine triphosphatase
VNPSKQPRALDALATRESDGRRVLHVAVGSRNPVKRAAVQGVFDRLGLAAVVRGVPVASGVPEQPWGDAQTIAGARERARGALDTGGVALGVGLEGGVVDEGDLVRSCAWCVVVDDAGIEGVGGSLAMPLPPIVARRLREGGELGPVMDALSGRVGVKHGPGAVGLLTAGLVDRQAAYEMLLAYALSPWLGASYWVEGPEGR